MPPFRLSHDASLFTHSLISNTTSTHNTTIGAQSNLVINSNNYLFSRSLHMLHRRNASPGVIGIVVGLTLLATTVGVGLFVWNWRTLKQMEVQKNQKRQRKHHRHRHSSHQHHHTQAVLDGNLEDMEDNLEHISQDEDQHQEIHHHPNCRHQRLHHRNYHPTMGDWTPQRPEHILSIPSGWSQHRYSIQPPNEMDAPQIHEEGNMPRFFGQRRDKRERVAKP